MRMPYQFNEKDDPEDATWGMNAEGLLEDFVNYNRSNFYADPRGIEAKINAITEVVGGLADILIMKGILSPQDLIEAIGSSYIYEVRENKL